MSQTVRRGSRVAPPTRKRNGRRWTVIAAALSTSALAGSYLGFVANDSDAVAVDAAAYYEFVSVHSGNALDVAGSDDADGVRIQQEQRASGSASQSGG